MSLLRLLPLIPLAACTLSMPSVPDLRPEPTRDERIVAECALLDAAAIRMAAAATPASPGLTEGCPGSTERDTRPLDAQTAALRAANAAPLPAGLEPGGRADQVFRRMITRGVPVAIATALAQEPVFAAAAR